MLCTSISQHPVPRPRPFRQPTSLFFCAAITGFAACRNDRELAERVNFSAPSVLARRLVGAGSRVVFLSSNAVFDWREPHVPANREPRPVTEYGHFKAKAEKEFSALGSAASILRLSKVLRSDDRLLTAGSTI